MKFSVSSALMVTAAFSAVGHAAPPTIPEACYKIPEALGLKPLKVIEQFTTQVCDKANCTATINEHGQFFYETILPQAIQEFNPKLGVSADEQALFNQTSSQVVDALKKSCAAEGDKPLCYNIGGQLSYLGCALQAALPILEGKAEQIFSTAQITDERCQKITQLLSDEALWSQTIPGYVDQFATMCKAN
ncbi:hypothetical protein BDV26DRAFT_288504 [Aspergillus bertholletiae]|uniref:Uncharacterized protein n=1 Tax=Aspergillus bertholletiae TaxID=1226010 RepID=A0A5N7BL60_9EURO|nr:hypothetical protein BDV26DRAFT_288504 [Aspergillus bertholletiae]